MLGDVAQPGALVEPLEEAAAATARAGVLAQPGQHRDELVGEAGQRVGRELLERAEVDDQVDRLVVGPDVGAAVDAGLEDLQVRGGALAHAVVSVLGGVGGGGAGRADPGRPLAGQPPTQVARGRRRRRRCRGPAGAGRVRPRRALGLLRVDDRRAAGPGRGCRGRTPNRRAARGASRRSRAAARSAGPRGRWTPSAAGSKIVTAPRPITRSTSCTVDVARRSRRCPRRRRCRAAAGSAPRSSATGRSGCAGRSAGR